MDKPGKQRFRLLIFDLDDTLLDTWGQLVKPAVREACLAMIRAGLNADLTTCLQAHQRFVLESPRADPYLSLARHFGPRGSDNPPAETLGEIGRRAYFHREVEPFIRPFEGVYALLGQLRARYQLHLVTSGSPDTQARKIEILDLEPRFHALHFVNPEKNQGKATVFQRILEDSRVEPPACLVIGDRVDREIRAAKQLGMTTCRVRYGEFRHLSPSGPEEEPDYQINHIRELAAACGLY